MKKIIPVTLLLVTAIVINAQQKDFPKLTGPYLGQKPPGTTPEIFAPGIISLPDYFEHSPAVFTPDGKEVYWSAKPNDKRDYKIYYMKMVNGIWSQPTIASFCRENSYYQQFTLSPDGKKLYFTDGSKWLFVEKQNGAWSLPAEVLPNIISETDSNIWCVAGNGSIYFISRPKYDVYVARAINGGYETPEKLSSQINSSDTRENSVYVPPDESYIIIETSKDQSTCELYICFRMGNNLWSDRIKLPIKWGRFPSVSPDGKYLFFMTREGIYWVSAKIIEELRPQKN